MVHRISCLVLGYQAISDLLDYLDSEEFNRLSVFVGIRAALAFFCIFSVIMLWILIRRQRPIPALDKGWTWVVVSVALILIRVNAFRYWGADEYRFWVSLIWWNLSFAVCYTAIQYVYWNVIEPRRGNR